MKLIEWMKSVGLDDQQVADCLNALTGDAEKSVSASAVKKWKYDERIPRPDEMLGLHAVSSGKVEPNDFYGVASVSAEGADQ